VNCEVIVVGCPMKHTFIMMAARSQIRITHNAIFDSMEI